MRLINASLTQAELVESRAGSQVHHSATALTVLAILDQTCLVSSRAVEVRYQNASYRIDDRFGHELGWVVVLLQV